MALSEDLRKRVVDALVHKSAACGMGRSLEYDHGPAASTWGDDLPMPYKQNEPRRHKIPKARYRVENWREYEVTLRDRGGLTVRVTPEAIAAWHPARTGSSGAVSSLFGPRHRDRRDAAAGICPARAADRGAVGFGDDVAGSEPRCPRPYDAVAPQRRGVLGQ